MLIAQITDSHVEAPGVIAHGRYDARALLKRTLDQIAAMVPRVDFILHTGDVTHHGDVASTATCGRCWRRPACPMA